MYLTNQNNPKSTLYRMINGIKKTGLRKSQYVKNVLIIGWNRESQSLCDKMKEYPALGYHPKGFITVREVYQEARYKDVPLLGNLSSLEAWIKFLQIDEVLIAVEPNLAGTVNEVINICRRSAITYRIVTDVYDTIYGNAIHEVYHDLFAKEREFGLRRTIDFIGAIFFLLIFIPIFIITAIAIKIESRGPIFYSQIRLGKNGRAFRIYKFRSMVADAEKNSGPVWAQKNDPRITYVGRLMRATRVDELPQLMNILKGDMSFIGPRPERPFFVESFREQIPLYEKRLAVKPGVTGWAQVKWRYDETIEDVKEKLKYDLYYIENHSLLLDIKIFFLTFLTVMLQKGQ